MADNRVRKRPVDVAQEQFSGRDPDITVYDVMRFRPATEAEADELPLTDLYVLEPVPALDGFRSERDAGTAMRTLGFEGKDSYREGRVVKGRVVRLSAAIRREGEREREALEAALRDGTSWKLIKNDTDKNGKRGGRDGR